MGHASRLSKNGDILAPADTKNEGDSIYMSKDLSQLTPTSLHLMAIDDPLNATWQLPLELHTPTTLKNNGRALRGGLLA
jgi:hypothetical protein